jgi:hypothetical protein
VPPIASTMLYLRAYRTACGLARIVYHQGYPAFDLFGRTSM